jgi:transposase
VVAVFGAAEPHHAYLFTNRRGNRLKVLVQDGFGLWLAVRRLPQGRFVWAGARADGTVSIGRAQRDALVLGLPWQMLAHEMAVLKRLKFAAKSEAFDPERKSLLEEAIDADLEALSRELERERPAAPPSAPKEPPKRQPLPANLPQREIRHEPDSTPCGCALRRIGEDIAQKLDSVPGVFTVGRHVRGKWVCAACQTLVQAPVPAHVIDKGLPTAGLLAQVLVAKYADPLPLYRREAIFERAGMSRLRSTLAQWGACGVQLQPLVEAMKAAILSRPVLHADETPVAMLKPGNGQTHRAYLWSYGTAAFDPIEAVGFDFAASRTGRHAQAFLGADRDDGGGRGTLVCHDDAAFKRLFGARIVEAGCLAHARRTFFDRWASHKRAVAEQALTVLRAALTRYPGDGALPADNNQMLPHRWRATPPH